jgi:predicted HicB family RNase H-like nuclease
MTLRHKGYEAVVAHEDGQAIVRIAGIGDMISATASDEASVGDVFKDLVEDYLATCAEIGKTPQQPEGQ